MSDDEAGRQRRDEERFQERTAMMPDLPRRLGRYRIVGKLGAGGMGEVYAAEDDTLGRRVAVKVIAGEFARDATRVARFRREAQAVAKLKHPNIVTIHDYGTEGPHHYFVTEYVAGATLREVIRLGDVSRRRVIEIAIPIASALAAAHERGIVHRDIKPDNILIDEQGQVKLIDFGVMKLMEPPVADPEAGDVATPTRAGTVIGTPYYMAPEQIRGGDIDGSADIFALGVVLYELLAGRRPFTGVTQQDALAAILMNEPQPLPSGAADVELARLVYSMLSKTPQARPAASDVARELQRLLQLPAEPVARPFLDAADVNAPHNLPSETAPLLGRDAEVAAISRLLLRTDVRMLTLTGPAGTGKTRLALAVARSVLRHFPGGVWFVSLESIRDVALVGGAIAEALGVPEASLRDRLRRERALLVLDNFEQVADAAAQIAALLAGTEWLKALVTSHAPLHLRAEHEYPLDPLPPPSSHDSLEAIRANAAVQMFVDRAQSVRPDFELGADNAPAVAQICRVTGGLPLAIELAAVRVRNLSVAAILEGLRDPLTFLAGGPRDMPERQRALRSALEWSVALLDEREKRFFAELGVFEGGWSLQACREILGAGAEELLGALMDKSLVRRLPAPAEERFGMLDAIRRLAESHLAQSSALPRLAARHLAYFARFADGAGAYLVGPAQPLWAARLSAEYANLRAALGHAVETRQACLGLTLAAGIWKFWDLRGWYREGRDWLQRLLAISDDVDPALRWHGWYAHGVLADAAGDYEAAYASFVEQLAICRTAGDRWAIGSAINNVAIAALRLGMLDEAAANHAEALAVWRELGQTAAAALSLQNLGHVERARGATAAARERYGESAALFGSIGDRRGVALSLSCLADIDRDENRFDEAIARYEEALQTFMAMADHWQVARCMTDYGETCRRAGRAGEAASLLSEAALIFREVGDAKSGAEVLDRLAVLAADQQDAERALTLAAAAAAVRKELGLSRAPADVEAAVERARAIAGLRADEAWARGSAMSFAEAVEFAQSA